MSFASHDCSFLYLSNGGETNIQRNKICDCSYNVYYSTIRIELQDYKMVVSKYTCIQLMSKNLMPSLCISVHNYKWIILFWTHNCYQAKSIVSENSFFLSIYLELEVEIHQGYFFRVALRGTHG